MALPKERASHRPQHQTRRKESVASSPSSSEGERDRSDDGQADREEVPAFDDRVDQLGQVLANSPECGIPRRISTARRIERPVGV